MWSRFRIYFLIGLAMVFGMTVSQWAGKPAIAVQQEDPRTADLRDRLISGLKIRTTIPQKLVDSAFLWVRSNKANHDYPFFYFERVLRIRGKRAGVAIPPFTYPTKSLKND